MLLAATLRASPAPTRALLLLLLPANPDLSGSSRLS
jgi:hypothetical protein